MSENDWDYDRYQAEIRKDLLAEFETTEAELASDLAKLPFYTRLDFTPTVRWEVGKSPPGGDPLCILAIFEGGALEGDVKVYVFARADTKPEERMWLRYTH